MNAITFARGGVAKTSKPAKQGVVKTLVDAIVGDGGCGNGTVNGKKGFQPGNKCSGKENRNAEVAAARSAHTAASRAAKKHLSTARKTRTPLSKEGRASIKAAAAAHRKLQDARTTHQAARKDARNAKRRETRAAAKAANPKPPKAPKADPKAEAKAKLKAANAKVLKERMDRSAVEAGGMKSDRAAQHLKDLQAGSKAGAFDKDAVHGHVDRIARGAKKDELFAAAKAAGIEHDAKTKAALVEHLKGHIAGQGKGKGTRPSPEPKAAGRSREQHVESARSEIAAAAAKHRRMSPDSAPIGDRIKGDAVAGTKHAKVLEVAEHYSGRAKPLEAKLAELDGRTMGLLAARRDADHALDSAYARGNAKLAAKAAKRAKEELDAHVAEKKAVRKQVEDIRSEAREHAHAILFNDKAARIQAGAAPSAVRDILESRSLQAPAADSPIHGPIRQGEEFVGRIYGQESGPPVRVDYGVGTERAYHLGEHAGGARISVIALDAKPDAGTTSKVVHEHGHALEHQDPEIGRASLEFLEHRVGGEASVSMNEARGTSSYRADEAGRKDRFEDAFGDQAHYVGKDYGGRATEILSMGLQKLHDDPVHFARADPEYFKFVVGVAGGHLR